MSYENDHTTLNPNKEVKVMCYYKQRKHDIFPYFSASKNVPASAILVTIGLRSVF